MAERNSALGTKKPKAKPSKNAKVDRPDVKVFIAEYLRDSNGRRAAIAAGYSERSADSTASRLLKTAKVRSAVDKHQAEIIAKVQHDTGITLERTLREIARLSFFDVRKLLNEDGTAKAISELDDDTAAAIAGMDVSEITAGDVLIGQIKKYKLADKKGALDMLMKHLGGYKVDNEQKKPELAQQLAEFIGELHQSDAGRLPIAAQRRT